ncbi:MAG: EscU/YscU/HrcU family type III secretion system export apparatus switch protein [Gammaproteobacteria bacterium]|nr:EscU/YscU/HrcU family type III secretion system export apparatus switch protein [Gammaproteobacteria bacterium]
MDKEDLAVALYYDGDSAPKITATGSEDIARQIIALALSHDVPVYENPELVTLLATLELGDEIPEILYRTIAELICFAYEIKAMSEEDMRKNERENKDRENKDPP